MARDHLHVVLLPGSTFGHLIPFFQLSVALAKAGIHVSFVSTPRNIHKLPKLPPNLATLINMEFPLPSLGNDLLPEGAEATIDVPVKSCDFTIHAQGEKKKKKLENATSLSVESVESKLALKIITITYK